MEEGLGAVLMVWLVGVFVAGAIAAKKGHSFIVYGAFALLLSPLVGILIAAFLKPNQKVLQEARLRSGSERDCPHCAELVKAEAQVCKHCGRDVISPALRAYREKRKESARGG